LKGSDTKSRKKMKKDNQNRKTVMLANSIYLCKVVCI
jgi:hypothetical protein